MFKILRTHESGVLAVTRILLGVMLACHGAQKLLGAFGGTPPGVPAFIVWGAGPIELLGGASIAVGLFTRIASFLAKGLRAEGHVATVSDDGREGLDHALSGDHDLVILDIGLPGLDGFELLDRLRSQGSRVPVIVLTDPGADPVVRVRALESGADDVVPRDVYLELVARLRSLLRRAALRAAFSGRSGSVSAWRTTSSGRAAATADCQMVRA